MKKFNIESEEPISQEAINTLSASFLGNGKIEISIDGIVGEQKINYKQVITLLKEDIQEQEEEMPEEEQEQEEMPEEEQEQEEIPEEEPSKKEIPSSEIDGKIRIEPVLLCNEEKIDENSLVKQGQLLKYSFKITNISNEALTNVKLLAELENEVFYSLVEGEELDDGSHAHGYVECPDKKNEAMNIEKIEPNESVIFTYMAVVKDDVNAITSTVKIEANQLKQTSIVLANAVEEADLKLLIKSAANIEKLMYSNDETKYRIIVKNISDHELKDITVKCILPEELSYNKEYPDEVNQCEITEKNNCITYKIDKLKADEEKDLFVFLKVDSIDSALSQKDIQMIAEASCDEKTYISKSFDKINQSEIKI